MKGKVGGFYTEEIRNRGVRQGFRLITLDGKEAILAHVNIESSCRVSKYGVDIRALETIGLPALREAARRRHLVVIDEIGKMELLCTNFQQTVSQMIDGGTRMLGTIMHTSNPWIDNIKKHEQVNLLTVTRDNRQHLLEDIRQWLRATESSRP